MTLISRLTSKSLVSTLVLAGAIGTVSTASFAADIPGTGIAPWELGAGDPSVTSPTSNALDEAEKPDASVSTTGKSFLKQPPPQQSLGYSSDGIGAGGAFAFLLVLGLAGGAFFVYAKKKTLAKAVPITQLSIVSSLRLSPKAQIHVIKHGNSHLLLGVTEQQITHLGMIDDQGELSFGNSPGVDTLSQHLSGDVDDSDESDDDFAFDE